MACNTTTKLNLRSRCFSLTAATVYLAVATPAWSASADVNSSQNASASANVSQEYPVQSEASAGVGLNFTTRLKTDGAAAGTSTNGEAAVADSAGEPAAASRPELPETAIPQKRLEGTLETTTSATQKATAVLSSGIAGASQDGMPTAVSSLATTSASEISGAGSATAASEVAKEVSAAVESAVEGDIASSIDAAIQQDILNVIQQDLTADLINSLPLPGME